MWFNSDWGEFLEKIVKKVVEEVFKSGPLEVAENSVAEVAEVLG